MVPGLGRDAAANGRVVQDGIWHPRFAFAERRFGVFAFALASALR
jgi:hypothetical protein